MTTKNPPPSGSVFDYPFLWSYQAQRGLENAKDRICCLAFTTLSVSGERLLVIVPISDRPAEVFERSIELSAQDKLRAGLNPARPAYLHINEYNMDRFAGSWYFNSNARVRGRIGNKLLRMTVEKLVANVKRGLATGVDRTRP